MASYGTAQFKLDRTRVQQGHDTTRFVISHVCKPACARKIGDIKPTVQALMYALDMCMMHTCMLGIHMPNLYYMCMHIVSQGQRNKLYKHVYVLRCNPPCDTKHKSC